MTRLALAMLALLAAALPAACKSDAADETASLSVSAVRTADRPQAGGVSAPGQPAGERLWSELPPAQGDPDPPIRARTFRNLARRANPAVVSIFSTQATLGRASIDPFGILPFGLPIPLIGTSLGSGFIIRADGLVLTADHVVAASRRIKIVLMANDAGKGREYKAKVLGRGKQAGIALLKFAPEKKLPVLPLGDSETVEIGDQVLAVGNPYGLSHTVTAGIVSFIGRELPERRGGKEKLRFIQIDAPINPGNSGGPLLNLAGEVIGINTAVAAGAEGIGFAVPINSAKKALPGLVRNR